MLPLAEAIRFLRRRPGRAVLAGTGIAAALAVVTTLAALASGAHRATVDRFEAMGLDRLWITCASDPQRRLNANDAPALEAMLRGVAIVAHSRRVPEPVLILVGNRQALASVEEASGPHSVAHGLKIDDGRALAQPDVEARALVCVLTTATAQRLGVTVGDRVDIADHSWRIVGLVYQHDADAIIPAGTLLPEPAAGPAPIDRIDVRFVRDDPARWTRPIYRLINADRIQGEPLRADVTVPLELARQAAAATHEIRMLELAIGIGGLAMGALCLVATMIASVRERLDEFGLRIMLGATPRAILMQIACETLAIAMIACAAGTLVGIGAAFVMAGLAGLDAFVSIRIVLFWCGATAIVGTVSVLAPAREATRVEPASLLGASA